VPVIRWPPARSLRIPFFSRGPDGLSSTPPLRSKIRMVPCHKIPATQQHDDDGLSRSEIRPHKQCTACIQIKQTGQPRYVAPPLFFPAAARQQKPPSLRRHDLPGSAKISQQPLVAAYLRVTPRLKAWDPLNSKRNLESYVAVNFEKIQSSDQNSRV
jgi:hypothetical protein